MDITSKITKEDLQKVREILATKGLCKDYHKQNFENLNNSEMTPVNNESLNIIHNGVIILNEEVYQNLSIIHELAHSSDKEIPFFLFGKEIANNQILFNRFFEQTNNQSDYETYYQSHNNNLVICKGYSRPSIGSYYENFSLVDLASIIQLNEVYKNKKIELLSCVITPSKDINFLYYDNKSQNFYRFNKVLVKNKNNMYMRINCYGDGYQDIDRCLSRR